jgi:hypothetical protein
MRNAKNCNQYQEPQMKPELQKLGTGIFNGILYKFLTTMYNMQQHKHLKHRPVQTEAYFQSLGEEF